MLGEKTALDAFDTYMKFYQSYSLPYSYSLETRIRSGEIPLAVANYSTYNVIKLGGTGNRRPLGDRTGARNKTGGREHPLGRSQHLCRLCHYVFC